MKDRLVPENILKQRREFGYFYIFASLYIASILTSITVSARLLPLHIPYTNFSILLTAGTWTIPIIFFLQDITTEVYGYAQSRRLVFLAIPIVIAYIGYLKLTTFFPMSGTALVDHSYNQVFNALPRHLLALLVAVAIGNLVNNYVLALSKRHFRGKYMALRFICSTAVGEAMLQLVGTSVAWFGSLNFETQIIPFVLFSYLYKVLLEVVLLPVSVPLSNYLKKVEKLDVYDI